MKSNCVLCTAKLPRNHNYKERGNWCVICDNKAEVTIKSDLKWFFNLAKALKI